MALRTHVTLHTVDGKGEKTRFSYESLDPNVSDASIALLIAGFFGFSGLGIEDVTITKHYAGFTPIPAASAAVRIGDTANLVCHKGAAFGGTYTFRLAAIRDVFLNEDGTFILNSTVFSSWCELFDDGAGLLGLQGPFTVSDGEQLSENGATLTLPSGLTQISGKVKNKR